jgi:tRNA 5-methylaminomethyl-2-thiouridine biosynthesis bifunctional protein
MYDVIIIGAGIAGASAAYHCTALGLKVLVLEQGEHIAPKASGNPAGILYPYMASNYDAMTAFYLQGLAHSISLLQQLDAKGDFHSLCGMLHLPKQKHELEELQGLSARLGLPPQIMQLHAQGFFMKASGWVNVPAFCEAMLAGVDLRLGVTVVATQHEDDKWHVYSDSGEQFCASHLVIASAYEAEQLLPNHHLPMRRIRGQITYLPAEILQNAPNYVLCYGGYLTPAIKIKTGDGVHYLGATFEKGRDDLQVDEAGHQTNIKLLQQHFESILCSNIDVSQLHGRAAFRTVSGDRFPIIGAAYDEHKLHLQLDATKYSKFTAQNLQIPPLPNLYVSLAHGARGITSAPLAGAEIASKISNSPYNIFNDEMTKLLSPSRFALRAWRKKTNSPLLGELVQK